MPYNPDRCRKVLKCYECIKFKSHKTKFYGDYYLRWWRLPIEERACRETDLGGGDYYLRNSGLPPSNNTGVLLDQM